MEDGLAEKKDKLTPHKRENTLDFHVQARSGKKRNYIYDYRKARRCTHPSLKALAIGGSWYRCEECNYAYCIVSGFMQPLHQVVRGSLLMALGFAKEHGMHALQEVARRPGGQYDGTAHKPVLPEGMSFSDAAWLLDEVIDVNVPDGGRAQLTALQDEVWVAPKERAIREKQLAGIDPHRRPKGLDEHGRPKPKEIHAPDQGTAGDLPEGQKRRRGRNVPRVQEGRPGPSDQGGDTRRP